MEKLKAYVVYTGKPEWYHCTLIFESGWAPFGHVCFHLGFAKSDLLQGRQKRKDVLKKMGIEVDLVGPIPMEELPSEIIEKNKDKESYKHLEEEYKKFSKEGEANAT